MSLSQLASKIVFKCPKISRKQAKWTLVGRLKYKMSFTPLAPLIPESLRVSQNQSQTRQMDSGGSHEVKFAILSIGTELSWKSASVQQYAAGQENGLLNVPKNLNCQYQHWHKKFLKVC
jgi:hypothetical protein